MPPVSGVYAIFDGTSCLLVGESWNLRARLLELANIAAAKESLTITFESCLEEKASVLRAELERELLVEHPPAPESTGERLPGISFWTDPPSRNF